MLALFSVRRLYLVTQIILEGAVGGGGFNLLLVSTMPELFEVTKTLPI
jgi:hypothetical protein